jgi:hypothetical protein
MAVTRTGTASEVDASAGNSSTSVTVPADATKAIAFWTHFSANGSTLATLTLGGNSFFAGTADIQLGVIDAGTAEPGGGVALLDTLPGTGTQTLAWTWSNGGARAEGGGIFVVWIKSGGGTITARDFDVNQGQGSDVTSITIDSNTGDLVVAMGMATGSNPNPNGTIFVNSTIVNGEDYDLTEITAGASSTTVSQGAYNYSVTAGMSLFEDAGEEVTPPKLRVVQSNLRW